ncbi:Titin [Fasciolopsis buskii]|uniref:Titin n=1 Tax=Fasciolopsis buskii TaxID=27845 RepID=A0A8E0RT90_9TREM|nr:Titin [Fasciolopsis buski]
MATKTVSPAMYAAGNALTAPQILSPLEGITEVPEGEPVHLELRVSPPGDLQVQWFRDGHPLSAGSRFNSSAERGIVSLDVIYTLPEDGGMYSCVIANPFGMVKSDPVMVNVLAEVDASHDQLDAQWADRYEATSAPTREYERDQRSQPKSPPQFAQQPVISSTDVLEGEPIRIEAQLVPTSDATLHVEWLHDGRPVGTGSRFNAILDRGLVVLEIGYCLAEDSGHYVCVASNALGREESHAVELRCQPEERVVTKSILDQTSINHLRELEELGEEHNYYAGEEKQAIPPQFKGPIEPASVHVNEDEPVVFSVAVDGGNGDRLTVEWRRDNQIVKTGSRITGTVELGIATLKIHYTQPTDAGVYTCHIATEFGHAESQPASLQCEASGTIIAASQLPGDKERGLQAIEAIEALLNAPRGAAFEEEGPLGAPQIVQDLQPVGDVEEGTAVHFEVHVEPSNDPSLAVYWYKNNDLLTTGTRFRVTNDRGVATLDLVYTIPEDSGEYWCKVQNAGGQTDSHRAPMKCLPSAAIITQSNLMQGSEGYNLIKAIEEAAEAVGGDFRYQEEEEPDSQPNFDVKPQAATISEGSPVRFLVRVSGKPTPRLSWYLNDQIVEPDSLTKIYTDGAINYLEMVRCPALQGSNTLRVIAENQLGRAEAETVLTVTLAEDYRPDLKHVQPENPFRKMMGLRKVDCTPELNKALTRTKPSAQAIAEMERGTEMKARNYRSPEVIEAERMLDQLALNLRKSEVRRPTTVDYQQANHQ